jgi:citrate lyase synthetase
VRKYMKEKKFDEIRKLVLPEIYEYLREHYMG